MSRTTRRQWELVGDDWRLNRHKRYGGEWGGGLRKATAQLKRIEHHQLRQRNRATLRKDPENV